MMNIIMNKELGQMKFTKLGIIRKKMLVKKVRIRVLNGTKLVYQVETGDHRSRHY